MKARPNSIERRIFPQITRASLKPTLLIAALLLLVPGAVLLAQDDSGAFLPRPVRSASTIPANGDLNPYGVAFVPPGFPAGGMVSPGNILVSNFNSSANLQGTGSTIVDITPGPPSNPAGAAQVFFQGGAGLGLTTALNILRAGFVLVGNFPTTGNPCPAPPGTPGSILVIGKTGTQVNTISGAMINGPWDSALFDQGTSAKLFVSNALTGTVVRLDLSVGGPMGVTVNRTTQIASGYKVICDSVTFIDGPTGLVYDPLQDILYVASTADNAVFAVGDAGNTTKDRGTGIVTYRDNVHLHGPLAMIQAPNGHLIVSNNDSILINSDPNHPSELTEFTKDGQFVKQISVDPAQGGSFGLAAAASGGAAKLAAVDDNQNILLIWTLPLPE
jgi:hypothetical protein